MECSWGQNTGDVDEPDGRARETKENMAKLKTKPRTKNITKLTDVAKTH